MGKNLRVEPHRQSPQFIINAPVGRHPPSKLGTGRPKDGVFVLQAKAGESSAAGVKGEGESHGFEKDTHRGLKNSLITAERSHYE